MDQQTSRGSAEKGDGLSTSLTVRKRRFQAQWQKTSDRIADLLFEHRHDAQQDFLDQSESAARLLDAALAVVDDDENDAVSLLTI